jgi:hypothetical protein
MMRKLGVFFAVVALAIAAAAIGNLFCQDGKLSPSPTAIQSNGDVSIHSRQYKEAFMAGATYWTCKQVCPDLNERHVKAAIFNRIRLERIGATVKEVETAFEAGAQSAGEPFSVNPTPVPLSGTSTTTAPETGASTPQP